MPLAPGFVEPAKLLPIEVQKLEQYGWKKGDPIPTNMAELIAEAERNARDPERIPLPVPADTPPLKLPEPVPLESLPLDQQLERQQAIVQALQMAKEAKAVEEAIPAGASPQVAQAIRAAMQPPPPAAAPTPPAQESPPTSHSDRGPELPKVCPRCSFDLTLEKDPIEVTEEDKTQFLVSWWGAPFLKTYKLYGGKVAATFQTISAKIQDEIIQAAWSLQTAGMFKDLGMPPDAAVQRMRLSLQLASLSISGHPYTLLVEPLKEMPTDQPGGRPWAWLKKFEELLPLSDSARHVLQQTHIEFVVLTQKLEALSKDEIF